MLKFMTSAALVSATVLAAAPAYAGGQQITNDLSKCRSGSGPAVLVKVTGFKPTNGRVRVQSYYGTKEQWLKKGAWLSRIEVPVTGANMTFCVPVAKAGEYAIAIRHDVNGNGKTDLTSDGGGMSNNPSISIFNLGKPSYTKTKFPVGNDVKTISINMKYL